MRDERAAKFEEMQAVRAKAEGEKRGLNAEERSQWGKLKGELEDLDEQIKVEEDNEKLQARMAGTSGTRLDSGTSEKDKRDIQKHYSWLGAVRRAAGYEALDGIYQEMHDEATKEARESGISTSPKGVMIPSLVLNEKRDVTATGGTNGNQGGVAIATNLMNFIDALRSQLVLAGLGADFMTGLVGNLDFPEEDGVFAPTWLTENGDSQKSSSSFKKKSMTPKRLAGHMDVSEQMLVQTSPSIEARLRNQMVRGVQQALDLAGINGSGSGEEPTGILQTSGIGQVVGGANGAAPTYDHIIKLAGAVDANDALLGSLGYLTNTKVRTALKLTKKDAGSGLFVWGDNNAELAGYKAGVTNLVPSNLSKGTGTNLSPIIFGNFNDLLIGQWAGIEILPDPYTQAGKGMIRMHVKTFADVLVARAKSFAAMKDAIAQ